MPKVSSPWLTDYTNQFKNLCMLYPVYKKTTAHAETCRICKVKGCFEKSKADPETFNVKNMCRFHFEWYNGMNSFHELLVYLRWANR